MGERFTTAVKRVPGGRMSNWMNDALEPGDTIDVMRPAGLFVLRATDAPIVAFAGGSGITPVISLVKSALATTERPIVLVYANRGADAVIFADELERLRARIGWPADRPSPPRFGTRLPRRRRLRGARRTAARTPTSTSADPARTWTPSKRGLSTLDVGAERRFIERFAVPAAEPVAEQESVTESLVIRIDRRKQTFPYQAGDTILEAARRAGLEPALLVRGG